MASSWQDADAASVRVRLDVFTFASYFSRPYGDDRFAAAVRSDVQALGLTLLEIVFGALSRKGPSEETLLPTWRRLALDVFGGSMGELRGYCT